MGSFLAWYDKPFKWPVLILALLTTLFLQVLSNLANDYGDSINGMDNIHRVGPVRTVQSGAISPKGMLMGIIITSTLAFLSGVLLIAYGFNFNISLGGLIFLLLGLGALAAAIKYTVGKNPYGYMGWGDFFVFVFFGLTGVLGTYYLHTGTLNLDLLLPASAVGLLSTAVLNLNNMRDIDGDARSGKRTLVVIMGSRVARIYHLILILSSWISLLLFTLINYGSFIELLYLLAAPLFIYHLLSVFKTTTPRELDPQLKRLAMATFATVILFGLGLL
jgi:1,4-dihydroxy-2-naphthoate octaprenyltransferase